MKKILDLDARCKTSELFKTGLILNETLHEVLVKVAFDFKLQGGIRSYTLVWSIEIGTQIAEVYHVDVSRARAVCTT